MSKIIYLAFANKKTPRLTSLDNELISLSSMLNYYYLDKDTKIIVNPCAELENLAHDLEEYQDQLSVFHFSGSIEKAGITSNDQYLKLINLLKKSELKLIVLNACLDLEKLIDFTNRIYKKNTFPVVVGIDKSIEEKDLVRQFSISFWKRLSLGDTFLNAYDYSKGILRSKSQWNVGYINCEDEVNLHKKLAKEA